MANLQCLLVGWGWAGWGTNNNGWWGWWAGEYVAKASHTVTAQAYTITIWAWWVWVSDAQWWNGWNTTFDTLTWLWGWWGWSSTYCWDSHVQRPNDDWQMEECDFWTESVWPAFCSKTTCRYTDFTIPSGWVWEITIPWNWVITFWPTDSVIIWAWMNPYTAHNLLPFIRNDSDYDMFFEKLCIADIDSWWEDAIEWTYKCEPLWLLPAHSGPVYLHLSTYNIFKWRTISSSNYVDDKLVTTVKHNWVLYDNAWFASDLAVRVSRPSIATVWWGTTYLSWSSRVWNISKVADNWLLNPVKNKNFVWAWISSWDTSSYSKEINDTNSLNIIKNEWNSYENWISNITDVSWTALWNTSLLSDFDNYNWIDNVFILKNKNFVVNSDIFAWINNSRTYIIENWDLRINSDINYSNWDNIAFVVKWGDIWIHKNVHSIDWTYVTIKKDLNWWKFIWVWGNTIEKLVVNWSLYGNIDNLISSRTFVKQNSNWQIDVWTIVSFGSYLFRKPAPLLSTFINEYLKSEKVAK